MEKRLSRPTSALPGSATQTATFWPSESQRTTQAWTAPGAEATGSSCGSACSAAGVWVGVATLDVGDGGRLGPTAGGSAAVGWRDELDWADAEIAGVGVADAAGVSIGTVPVTAGKEAGSSVMSDQLSK
jgi:hypothetical protein